MGGLHTPVGVQIASQGLHRSVKALDLPAGQGRHHRVKGHGVGDDGADRGKQTGDRRHHEAGRALTVDDRLDRLGAGAGPDGVNGHRVVVQGGAVERPLGRAQVQAGPPVLQPHVVALGQEHVDQVGGHRGPEDVGPHPRPVHQQDRAACGPGLAHHVHQVGGQTVSRGEWHDLVLIRHPRLEPLTDFSGTVAGSAHERAECGRAGSLAGPTDT